MDNSPLATLPAELRNAIYRDVVCLDQSIEFTVGEGGVKLYTIWRGRAHLKTVFSLLSTCRIVRQEALSLFYSENRSYFLRLVSVPSKRSVAAMKDALREARRSGFATGSVRSAPEPNIYRTSVLAWAIGRALGGVG